MADSLLAVPNPLPPFLHDAFQGYVTVSEINELYSQLRGDPKPLPNPTLATVSPESEINPCPDGGSSKSPKYEVCASWFEGNCCLVCSSPQFSSSFTPFADTVSYFLLFKALSFLFTCLLLLFFLFYSESSPPP